METHEIRYFLAVVRELNFTRAAAACAITQPALTRAIKKLEDELGGALFLRRPGQIEPTRLARELLPQLEAIEHGLEAVQLRAAQIAKAQTTLLRFGVMCTVGPVHVVEILNQLRKTLPDVEVSIVDGRAKEIVDLISSDQVDVGITAWPHYPDSVRVEPLLQERYVLAMRSDDELAAEVAVPLERLAGQNYVERLGCEFDDYYEAAHGAWTIDTNVVCSSEREDWIRGLLLAGLGAAIVPEFMEMPDGIVKRPLIEPEVVRVVSIATLRGKPLSPAAAAFFRIAQSHRWRGAP